MSVECAAVPPEHDAPTVTAFVLGADLLFWSCGWVHSRQTDSDNPTQVCDKTCVQEEISPFSLVFNTSLLSFNFCTVVSSCSFSFKTCKTSLFMTGSTKPKENRAI